MSPRPRDQILGNLETVYREAYDRAKTTGDERRMADLDSAYQRRWTSWTCERCGLFQDIRPVRDQRSGWPARRSVTV